MPLLPLHKPLAGPVQTALQGPGGLGLCLQKGTPETQRYAFSSGIRAWGKNKCLFAKVRQEYA